MLYKKRGGANCVNKFSPERASCEVSFYIKVIKGIHLQVILCSSLNVFIQDFYRLDCDTVISNTLVD